MGYEGKLKFWGAKRVQKKKKKYLVCQNTLTQHQTLNRGRGGGENRSEGQGAGIGNCLSENTSNGQVVPGPLQTQKKTHGQKKKRDTKNQHPNREA